LLTSEEAKLDGALRRFGEAVAVSPKAPQKHPLIYARVTEQGVE